MMHAFSWMPPPYRWALLVICLAVTVAFVLVLTTQGKPLRNPVAPQGVVSYEFAWTRSRAEQILESWHGLEGAAEQQLLIDFGFLAVYPVLLSLGCALLSETSANALPAVGVFISWAVLAAGPLDALENAALLRMLHHGAGAALAQAAGWCAGLKFLVVFSALGYLVLQGAAVLVGKALAG